MFKGLIKHFWIIHLGFISAAVWLTAQLSVVVIQNQLATLPKFNLSKDRTSPFSPGKSEPYEQYSAVTERNIFNPAEKGLPLPPLQGKSSGIKGERGKDSPTGRIRLIGTVTGPDRSYAIIQEEGKQKIYPLHSEVDGGRIVQISRDRILLDRHGKEEVLSTWEKKGAPPPPARPSKPEGEVVQKLSANRFLVNREDVTASVGNVNQFMTQARFKPYFVGGQPGGFSVSEIQPGTLMEKLGLRNQDVVKRINGRVINKPEDVFQAYSQLLRDSNIEVEIERNARTEVLRYEIR